MAPVTPLDRPAAESTGGGRAQDAQAGRSPSRPSALPVSAFPRGAAGTPRPFASPVANGRGTPTPAAASDLALGAAAGHDREDAPVPADCTSLPGSRTWNRRGPASQARPGQGDAMRTALALGRLQGTPRQGLQGRHETRPDRPQDAPGRRQASGGTDAGTGRRRR